MKKVLSILVLVLATVQMAFAGDVILKSADNFSSVRFSPCL